MSNKLITLLGTVVASTIVVGTGVVITTPILDVPFCNVTGQKCNTDTIGFTEYKKDYVPVDKETFTPDIFNPDELIKNNGNEKRIVTGVKGGSTTGGDNSSTNVRTGNIKTNKVQVGNSKKTGRDDNSNNIKTGSITAKSVDLSTKNADRDIVYAENVTINNATESLKSIAVDETRLGKTLTITTSSKVLSVIIPDPELLQDLVKTMEEVKTLDIDKLTGIQDLGLDKLNVSELNDAIKSVETLETNAVTPDDIKSFVTTDAPEMRKLKVITNSPPVDYTKAISILNKSIQELQGRQYATPAQLQQLAATIPINTVSASDLNDYARTSDLNVLYTKLTNFTSKEYVLASDLPEGIVVKTDLPNFDSFAKTNKVMAISERGNFAGVLDVNALSAKVTILEGAPVIDTVDLNTRIDEKASIVDLNRLFETVGTKAAITSIDNITTMLSSKADTSTVISLSETVNDKVSNSAFMSLATVIGSKAEEAALEALALEVESKATADDITAAIADKVDTNTFNALITVVDSKASTESVTILNTAVASKADVVDLESLEVVVKSKASAVVVDGLADSVATKASTESVTALTSIVATKASTESVTAVSDTLATKADTSTITGLEIIVDNKASTTVVDALATAVGSKASVTLVTAVSEAVNDKASASSVTALETTMATKADGDALGVLEAVVKSKASVASVIALETVVANKADNSTIASLATTIASKVDASTVTELLATKADGTEIGLLENDIADIESNVIFATNTASSGLSSANLNTAAINSIDVQITSINESIASIDRTDVTEEAVLGVAATTDIVQLTGTVWLNSIATNPGEGTIILNSDYALYIQKGNKRYYQLRFYTSRNSTFTFQITGAQDIISVAGQGFATGNRFYAHRTVVVRRSDVNEVTIIERDSSTANMWVDIVFTAIMNEVPDVIDPGLIGPGG